MYVGKIDEVGMHFLKQFLKVRAAPLTFDIYKNADLRYCEIKSKTGWWIKSTNLNQQRTLTTEYFTRISLKKKEKKKNKFAISSKIQRDTIVIGAARNNK